jgi:hypothetical protein
METCALEPEDTFRPPLEDMDADLDHLASLLGRFP